MRATVYAVEGRRVRHPKTGRVVSEDGDVIVVSSFWTRLERDGDVVIEPIESGESTPGMVGDE